jgi:hypothetical protein
MFTAESPKQKHARKIMEIMSEATFQLNYLEHMDRVMLGITQLAMPKDGKFDYPIDKKRTKQTTEAMINAEKNLDLFWIKFDANWRRLAGKNIDKCMGDHNPGQSGQKIKRTAPWVEPVKEAKKLKVEPVDLDVKAWTDSTSTKEEIPAKPSKQKVKTKRVNVEQDTGTEDTQKASLPPAARLGKNT